MLAQEVADSVGWADAVRLAVMVVGLLAGLSTLGWALSRRIKHEAKTAATAAAQVAADAKAQIATKNGHTAGELLEAVAADTGWLKTLAQQNRETALAALALSREAVALVRTNEERLTEHERTGHGGG